MKKRIIIVIAFLGATYFLLQFVIALKSDQAVLVDALTKTFQSEHLYIEQNGNIQLNLVDESVVTNEIIQTFLEHGNSMDYHVKIHKDIDRYSSDIHIGLGDSEHYLNTYFDGEELFIGDGEKNINAKALFSKETNEALKKDMMEQLSIIIPKYISDEHIYQHLHQGGKIIEISYGFTEANELLTKLAEVVGVDFSLLQEIVIVEKFRINFMIDETGFIWRVNYFVDLLDKKYGSRKSSTFGHVTISEHVIVQKPANFRNKYQTPEQMINAILSKESKY